MYSSIKIALVIPAYFERENLPELTDRLLASLDKLRIEFKITYVIQGDDGSREFLLSLNDNHVNFLYYPEPLGVAAAFLAGFKEVVGHADYILTMDADLNHQPEEIYRLWECQKKTNADIVIGSRHIQGGKIIRMPLWKKFAGKAMNKIINIFSGIKVADKTSGFRIYKPEVIRCVMEKVQATNFEFYPEVIMVAHKAGFTFAETPITFIFRKKGESKMNKFQTIIGYMKIFWRRIL